MRKDRIASQVDYEFAERMRKYRDSRQWEAPKYTHREIVARKAVPGGFGRALKDVLGG